jgi:hypothetical protein
MSEFTTAGVTSALDAMVALEKQGKVKVNDDQDGLTLELPQEGHPMLEVKLSSRLLTWLEDLRLLRHLPLAYLVPDPALLPPESIRFFHVNQTFTDRVIEGALCAGNIGTVDMTFSVVTLTKIRELLDERLEVTGKQITGMLIRSELVERWPDLVVHAVPDTIRVIRRECLSKSILIALFAGVPTEVRIREPDVGLRFGVEQKAVNKYTVDMYDNQGAPVIQDGDHRTFPIKLVNRKLVAVADLKGLIDAEGLPGKPFEARMKKLAGDPTRSRDVAINLRQLPYVARFIRGGQHAPAPDEGSQLQPERLLRFKSGRTFTLESLAARRGVAIKGDD